MFARMQFVCALLLATTLAISAGCEAPGNLQQSGTLQQQSPAKTDASEVEMDVPSGRIEARTHLAAARLHESQDRLLMAVHQYQLALAEDPRNVQILARMGLLNDRLGNGAAAEKNYLEALRYEPDNAQIHNNLGFSYILRQRWEDAERALNRAVELAPEFARARMNLALALAQRGQFEDAHRQFLMVLPTDEAWYNLGLMYQSKRKTAEAAEAYKRALQDNPQLTAAAEQLKRIPADLLAVADRKLEAEQAVLEAEDTTLEMENAAAEEEAADLEQVAAAASQPAADEPGSTTAAPLVIDNRLSSYLNSVADGDPLATLQFANEKQGNTAQVESDCDEPMSSLTSLLIRDLDEVFPPWQQSPELVRALQQECWLLGLGLQRPWDQWNDWTSSPVVPSVSIPVTATDRPGVLGSVSPE